MRLADSFEDAFVGTTISAFGRKQVAIYDYDKCILILMHDNHMTEDDAIEYFDYNVIGSWVGEDTPIYINQHTILNIEDYLEDQDEEEKTNTK
jgi:hypothetical protein|tara:strand:+ start:827 stop:1105 length:279 start_codon:yes stop_codon:yes gene_type:complete